MIGLNVMSAISKGHTKVIGAVGAKKKSKTKYLVCPQCKKPYRVNAFHADKGKCEKCEKADEKS